MGAAFDNRPQKVLCFAHLKGIFRAHSKAVQFPEARQYSFDYTDGSLLGYVGQAAHGIAV